MAIDLSGRVCVITGAGRGIGKAVAEGFTRRGAVVVATDLKAPEDVSGVAAALAWDVTDPAQAAGVMDQVVARFGRVDALVANAGACPRTAWDQVSVDHWRQVLAINLDGAWYGAQAAARHMTRQGYGKIVLVSSIEYEMGVAVHTHYDAAKAGLIGLCRAMARAVGPSGIRVNTLMPGAILTEAEREQFPDVAASERAVNSRQCIPGRILPEMIEPSFAFLCSAESDIITGQVLCADQGNVHY